MPPSAPAARPPACRDSEAPQPRSRGSMYCNWASSTCALPSRLVACWAKMSRITAVRSTTLTLVTSSNARRWLGGRSSSTMMVSASSRATMPAISLALPEPTYVAASGRCRCCSRPSQTSAPAVSASAASSRSDSSAWACVVTALDQTPTSTTRSSRTLRYSTSVTSCISPRPTTCLRALRPSRSSHSSSESAAAPEPRRSSSSSTSDCSDSTSRRASGRPSSAGAWPPSIIASLSSVKHPPIVVESWFRSTPHYPYSRRQHRGPARRRPACHRHRRRPCNPATADAASPHRRTIG